MLQDGECVPSGPEKVPAGECGKNTDKYMGSSGYRLIPGNTCDKSAGIAKDIGVMKDCSKAAPAEGAVIHQIVSPNVFAVPVRLRY